MFVILRLDKKKKERLKGEKKLLAVRFIMGLFIEVYVILKEKKYCR